jgi:hypothetical protein
MNMALSSALPSDFQCIDHFALKGTAKPFRRRNPIIARGSFERLK